MRQPQAMQDGGHLDVSPEYDQRNQERRGHRGSTQVQDLGMAWAPVQSVAIGSRYSAQYSHGGSRLHQYSQSGHDPHVYESPPRDQSITYGHGIQWIAVNGRHLRSIRERELNQNDQAFEEFLLDPNRACASDKIDTEKN